MSSVTWPLVPAKSTTWASVTLSGVPAAQTFMLEGVDGGIESVWRSFPGHIRVPDTNRVLATVDGAYTHEPFVPDVVEPFTVRADKEYREVIRGFLVGSTSTGRYELWFRKGTDATGIWRKQVLTSYTDSVMRVTADSNGEILSLSNDNVFGADSPSLLVPLEETLTKGFVSDRPLLRSWITGVVRFDDGSGHGLETYVAGACFGAGGSTWLGHKGFVAKVTSEGTLVRVGSGRWNERINGLAVACGRLWVYGYFTRYGDRELRGLAYWNGEDWMPVEQGLVNGRVYDVYPKNIPTSTVLYAVGSFTGFKNSAGTTTNSWYNAAVYGTASTTPYWGVCKSLESVIPSGGACRGIKTVIGNVPYSYVAYGSFNRADNKPGIGLLSYGVEPAGSGSWTPLDISRLHLNPGDFGNWFGADFTFSVGGGGYGTWLVAGGVAVDAGVQRRILRAVDLYDPLEFPIWNVPGGTAVLDIPRLLTQYAYHPGRALYICVGGGSGSYSHLYKLVINHPVGGNPSATLTPVDLSGVWDSENPHDQRIRTIQEITGNVSQGLRFTAMGRWHGRPSQTYKRGGGLVTACSRGRYLYLYGSDGHHRVFWWDHDTGTFKDAPMGPGPLWIPPPDDVGVSTAGVIESGRVAGCYRLYDPWRRRWSVLGDISRDMTIPTGSSPAPAALTMHANTLGTDNAVYTAGMNYVQTYRTLSSLDSGVAAGGYLYRTNTFEHNGRGGFFTLMGSTSGYNRRTAGGEADVADTLTDGVLPQDPGRVYDVVAEQVGELGSCLGACFYQGCVVAVEDRSGSLMVRWSNPWRDEPENFPDLNTFPLDVPSSGLRDYVRLVPAGDYVVCIAGSTVVRVQKAGSIMQAWKIGNIPKLAGRNAACAGPGGIVVVATVGGLYEVNAASGRINPVSDASTLFTERWKEHLRNDGKLSVAWDSILNVVYVHNGVLGETAMLWLGTGRLTVVRWHGASVVVSAPRLTDGTSPVIYCVWPGRFVTHPNWNRDHTVPLTMSGAVYTGSSDPYIKGVTVVNDGSGRPRRLTGFTSGVFNAGGGETLTVAGVHVAVLNSDGTTTVARCVRTGPDYLEVDRDLLPGGCVVALSPVAFGVATGPLWHPRGFSDLMSRKVGSSVGLTVTDWKPGPGPQPAGRPWIARGGFFRVNHYMETVPVTDGTSELFPFRARGTLGSLAVEALDRDRMLAVADGTTLVGGWEMILSNEVVDVAYMECRGRIDNSIVAGQRGS